MQYSDNSQQAAEFLRQAVPLMVKYKIPPHPLNYALWYTYVTQRLPTLNQELDKTITKYGTCPAGFEAKLFRNHLISDEMGSSDKLQSALITVATSLNESAGAAVKHTSEYSALLQESLDALNSSDPDLPLETIAQSLYDNTVQVSATAEIFLQQITNAQQEIQRLQEELSSARQDVYIDTITKLYNRRFLDETLQRICSGNDDPILSVIMMDIDHFKQLNDQYGHIMGDRALQCIGQLLTEECQDKADAVRYGGEEFAVLLYECDSNKAAILADRLRQKIQSIRIKHKPSGVVINAMTASFGVTVQQAFDLPEQLIDRADRALYQAKENGRNQVQTVLD
ncbi:GGDEF domain-containing protein [Nitrincola sp. MINF-07-Sa-05]|uniref:GGDEF domain-containing protein n=1 Tax=Nitrincola salilacus TaxID=3400273 RepID=UPI0039180067